MREGAAKGRGEMGRALQGLGRGLGVHPRPQEWQQLVYSEPKQGQGLQASPAQSSSRWHCNPSRPAPRHSSCVTPRAPPQGTEAADAAGGQSPASRSRSWVLETIL